MRGGSRSTEVGLIVVVAFILAMSVGYLVAKAFEPVVPRCAEDDVITEQLTCAHPDTAEFDGGYWHSGDAGLIPPLVIEEEDK